MNAHRSPKPGDIEGKWVFDEQRYRSSGKEPRDIDPDEQLYIKIHDDNTASVKHVVHHTYTYSEGSSGVFSCTLQPKIDTSMVQWFKGKLEGGVLVAYPERESERTGHTQCSMHYVEKRAIALKLLGSTLVVYRTDGESYPEKRVFTKS